MTDLLKTKLTRRAVLQTAAIGLQGLSKAGLRYPIMPYGPQAESAEGMAQSYAGKT